MLETDDQKGLEKLKAEKQKLLRSLKLRLLSFLGVFTLVFALSSAVLTSAYQWSNGAAYVTCQIMLSLGYGDKRVSMAMANGERQSFRVRDYQQQAQLKKSVAHLGQATLLSGVLGVLFGLLSVYLLVRYLKTYQAEKKNKKIHLRGVHLAEPEALEALMRERQDVSDFCLGTLPIPASVIDRHLYFSGDTGNGKSQALMQVLDVVRGLDEKLIILDKNGEMLSRYYDESRDYILGPFDDRTQNWTTYCEGSSEVDFEKIARSFVPKPAPGKETHWTESAINLFSVLLDQLSTQSDHSRAVEELYAKLLESKKVIEQNLLGKPEIVVKRGVYEMVKGTIAHLSVDEFAPEHASSVVSSLIPHIRSLNYMRGLNDRPTFSIKNWVKNPNDKGWVFIRVSEDYFEMVEPLVRTWLDTAIKAVLSLKKPNDYRVWFVVDELQSLDSINSLKKGLHEGRGHGLRCILGFTSVHELFETYGEHTAKGMLGQCNTKVSFGVSEPGAAEWNAKLLGSEEVIRENESNNFGDRISQGSAEQLHESNVVTPSQLQTLPRFHAYVKFSGDWPVTQIKTQYKERPEIAPYSVERILPPAFKWEPEDNSTEDVPAQKAAPHSSGYRENEPLI